MPFVGRVGRPGLLGLAARTAVVAGTASAVSNGVNRRQQRRAQAEYDQQQYQLAQQQAQIQVAEVPAAEVPAAPSGQSLPVAGGTDLASTLQQLAELQAQGILSPEEFAAAKAKLLA